MFENYTYTKPNILLLVKCRNFFQILLGLWISIE